jgi:hypothetical protein
LEIILSVAVLDDYLELLKVLRKLRALRVLKEETYPERDLEKD